MDWFGLIPLATMLYLVRRWIFNRLRQANRKRQAGNWPATPATINGAYALASNRQSGASGPVGFLPVIQYSYSVNNEFYSGSFNLAVYEPSQESAQDTGKKWMGQKILVRYDPRRPESSIYMEADGAPRGTRLFADSTDDRGFIDLSLNQ